MVLTTLISTLGAAQPEARAQASRLYIVFLPGLCGPTRDSDCQGSANAGKRAQDTFALLRAALRTARVRYTPVYYSYDPKHTRSYTVNDTRQVLKVSVSALDRQVRALLRRDPGAEVDLVGYSLGGVVAASWTVGHARVGGKGRYRGVRPFLHSLVTMDSPLKGIQGDYLAPLLANLYGGGIWYDLRPSSAAIRQIVGQGNTWWRRRAHLHSAANSADILVPPNEALLGVRHTVTDRDCSLDLGALHTCHGAVLTDHALARFIACRWITTAQQCAPQTPVPTSTPTSSPTPTATSSPTPSATPTASPTAGGGATAVVTAAIPYPNGTPSPPGPRGTPPPPPTAPTGP